MALRKLPKYEGYVIRTGEFNLDSKNTLDMALETKSIVRMKDFTLNLRSRKEDRELDTVLATTPGGNALYTDGTAGTHPITIPFRLVIKSKTGAYITPVAASTEQEVTFIGKDTPFKVLGKAEDVEVKDIVGEEVTVVMYFLEEAKNINGAVKPLHQASSKLFYLINIMDTSFPPSLQYNIGYILLY